MYMQIIYRLIFMEEVSERLKVRAILEEPADCAYGNWVQICGKLTLAEAPSNDGAFDRLFTSRRSVFCLV